MEFPAQDVTCPRSYSLVRDGEGTRTQDSLTPSLSLVLLWRTVTLKRAMTPDAHTGKYRLRSGCWVSDRQDKTPKNFWGKQRKLAPHGHECASELPLLRTPKRLCCPPC